MPTADLSVFKAEIDHLVAWLEHAMRYAPNVASRLTWLHGYPPYHQGRYHEAKDWVERALELSATRGLHDSELEAQLLNDLGSINGTLGDPRRALKYQEQALAIRREVLGEKHPDIAASLNNLGSTHGALRDHKRAPEHQEQAVAIWREVLGEKHPSTINGVLGLASGCIKARNGGKAVSLLT